MSAYFVILCAEYIVGRIDGVCLRWCQATVCWGERGSQPITERIATCQKLGVKINVKNDKMMVDENMR